MSFFIANAPTVIGPYTRKTDLAYGVDPRQRLDVYMPRSAPPPAHSAAQREGKPVVIFWYGGGWTNGNKANYRFVGAALAARGFVTVLPDYRVYPAVRFPFFLHDAADAAVWVQRHARQWGGDPRRIVLMGHSAGAHMAAFLAFNQAFLKERGGNPDAIAGLIGLSGPYALEPNSDTLRAIFNTPYAPADWQPVKFVSRRSPPTLLVHGLADELVTYRHAEVLRDALRQAGVRVETQLYPKRKHADTVAAFTLAARFRAPVLQQSVEFIRSVAAPPLPENPPLARRGMCHR